MVCQKCSPEIFNWVINQGNCVLTRNDTIPRTNMKCYLLRVDCAITATITSTVVKTIVLVYMRCDL